MKKLLNAFSLIGAVLFLFAQFGCSNPQEYGEDNPKDEVVEEEAAMDTSVVMAELDEMRNAYMAMVESGDYSAMQEMGHPDFMAVGPTGPEWDELRSYAPENGPYPVGARLMISPMETIIINEEWAYEMGKSQMNYTPEGADEAMILHDTYLMLFRNEGDGWKLYREVATSVLPSENETM